MARIVLPVEIKAREFFGKIWLAGNLVDRGHEVVIGDAHEIFDSLDILEPDLYFAIGPPARDDRIKRLDGLKECGTTIVLLDTEGAAFDKERYQNRVSKEVFDRIDYFYAWGEKSSGVAIQEGCDPQKVIVTGNPRFDLLFSPFRSIYRQESKSIRDEYGEYILINTNFGVNHRDVTHMLEYGQEDTDRYKHQTQLLAEFVSAICTLHRQFPQWTIIIRPHPVEEAETYRRLFWPFENIIVTKEGQAEVWIKGADAVIQNSCTTAVEAVFLDRPVFSFQPTQQTAHLFEIPNKVSELVQSSDELISELTHLPERRSIDSLEEETYELLRTHFENVEVTSATVIADHIDSISITNATRHSTVFSPSLARRVKRLALQLMGEKKYDKYYRKKIGRFRSKENQKFPTSTVSETNEVIKRVEDHLSSTGLKAKRVKQLERIYIIKKHHGR